MLKYWRSKAEDLNNEHKKTLTSQGFLVDCLFNYLAKRSLLALNLATFFALIFISSPVKGLRPFLAALLLTENVPKPTNVNLSPFFKVLVTPSRKELSAVVAATLVISASSAILVISSALVIKKYGKCLMNCLWGANIYPFYS